MKESAGRKWLQEKAREMKEYDGNRKPIASYESEVRKLMTESDNKRAEKKREKKCQ